MYARAELDAAHARYWALIREGLEAAGLSAPAELTVGLPLYETWHDPTLLLGQTCGLPYRRWLHGAVQLVGTPNFGVEGCPPGWYRSAIVCRSNSTAASLTDLHAGVFAYNGEDSQSGYGSLMAIAHREDLSVANRLETGAHVQSVHAVAEGKADFAAIDAVSWRLIQRYDTVASSLRVVDWTDPTPGLPYIAALGVDVVALRGAIESAIERLKPDDRDALGIINLVQIPSQHYLAVDDTD